MAKYSAKSIKTSNSTQTIDKILNTVSTQSDPKPMKRTRDAEMQTENFGEILEISDVIPEPDAVLNHNFSHRSSISSPPVSNTDTISTSCSSKPSIVTHSNTDNDDSDSDSDNELSPEDLAKLVAEVKNSSRQTAPLSHAVTPALSSESIFIRDLAPSYGQNKTNYTTTYGEESICEQLAKKYGILTPSNGQRRQTTPDETFQNSADMSLATAQYFERHAIGQNHRSKNDRTFQHRTTDPIVDFVQLEKLQNFK